MSSEKDPNFKVMLAHTYEEKRIKDWDAVFIDPKLDGVRVLIAATPSTVTFYSRNGRELDMFSDDMIQSIQELRDSMLYQNLGYKSVMFDGEMTGDTFGDIAGTIHRKGYKSKSARFNVFHAIPLSDFRTGKDSHTQRMRHIHLSAAIEELGEAKDIEYREPLRVRSHTEVMQVYKLYRRNKHEGAMVKLMDQPWEAKRSYSWLKIKDQETFDLRIVGFKEGKGKYKGTLGALIVDHKGVEVPVSGMTDALRDVMWRRRARYLYKVCEVECHEVTVHGSLRHPRFIRMREDKS